MIRNFWFAPEVCDAMNNHDETLSVCMTSVTRFMQDQASRHGTPSPDLEKFDKAVCKITVEAIASTNPHLRKVIIVQVNRTDDQELGDVEVRLNFDIHNLLANNPGLRLHH